MAILIGSGIDQKNISYLEGKFSVTFPDDYQKFLNKYNGFRVVSPDYCDIPFDKVDNGLISFDALLGYQLNNDNFDIADINDDLLDELSFIQHAVIIGLDPSDNCYVAITKGSSFGIYYWDRTCLHAEDMRQNYAISGEDESSHLYFVAESFTQFFEKITDLTLKKGMNISTGL